MKKTIIITVIVTLLILSLLLYLTFKKADKEETIKQNSVQITEFNVKDRTTLKINEEIFIGNNVKELENNFYDIKITNMESGVVIYLNKLWYETYGTDYIQDEYLARICREVANRLNIQNETEQFEYVLYKYIKDNYVKVRQNQVIEKLQTDKLSLNFDLEDNVVKLIIRGSE